MITEEHLNHWIKEIRYQVNAILTEVQPDHHLSRDYLKEKATTILGVTKTIEEDMKNDIVTPTVPKFCPNGCGETIEAKLVTGTELEMCQRNAPRFKNHWKIKCAKCGVENYISEGMKD